MTQEQLDKIASDYLNDCESESDMLEVFAVAKAATDVIDGHIDKLVDKFMESLFDATLDKIRAEVEQYQADCVLSCSDDANCRICDKITFDTIYRIIDKYRKGQTDADSD